MKIYFLILFLILKSKAFAGEAISFELAKTLAWKNNRQLAVLMTDVDRQSISRKNIGLKYKPEIKTYLGGEVLGSSDEFKASGIANLKGSYNIYNGKQREAAEKIADYEIEISKLDQDKLKAKLGTTLKGMYIEYDFFVKSITELEKNATDLQKFIKLAQTRQKLGTSTGTERANFEVELSVIKAEIEQKKAELNAQIDDFNFTLGTDKAYLPEQNPKELLRETDEAYDQDSSQSMKAVEINLNLTNARIEEHEQSMAPKIDLEAYVGLLPYSERDLERPLSAGVALVGSYDLMDRSTINSRKKEIFAEKNKNMAIKEVIAFELTQRQKHLSNVSIRLINVIAKKAEALNLAKIHYKKSSAEYRTGIASLIEIKDSWERMLGLEVEIRELERERYRVLLLKEIVAFQ
ncbi:MAG: TolC family protein [Oligoflexales bacterium]|nr:TolC family protein [Oligoflexales bacterium]